MPELIEMPFGLRTRVGPRNRVLGVHIPMARGNFGGRAAHCKYMDFLSWAVPVAERLKGSICRLDCELRLIKGSTSSIVFARWRQVCPHGKAHGRHLANRIEPSVCGGDAVLCQITFTTCVISSSRYDVKCARCVPLVRGSIWAAAWVRRVRLHKSNCVKIIPVHMMIREIIPSRQQRVRRCPL